MPNRPLSPGSSSSEEVILFRGRKDLGRNSLNANELLRGKEDRRTSKFSQQSSSMKDVDLSIDLPSSRYRKYRRSKGQKWNQAADEDIVDDYINNLRDNGELDCLLGKTEGNQRDLGGRDTEVVFSSSDYDAEHITTQDVNKTARNQVLPHGRHYFKSTELSLQHTEDTGDEDALVKLIAAQDLDSSSDIAPDTQTSEPNFPEPRSPSRHGYYKQEELDYRSAGNIQSKNGKRYGQMPLYNDDSDLERQLQVAWKNDRMRKTERKRRREELRSLGMLRINAKPDDLRTKYPSGMSIEQIGKEFEEFLRSRDEVYGSLARISQYSDGVNTNPLFTSRLSFPPMDLHARKVIHELANRFNIKSKSTGKAVQRRPTLYRTIRTQPYAEAPFQKALGQVQRRFMPRLDIKGKRKPTPSATHCQTRAAASYHEGEVVGASAPELGADNRGRAMLEKMGWCRGTALGATDNKGILQPVTQTMRRSKAGLA
ncbi:Single-stranded nucleic acid binding R3H [Metarhizium album ARSEF 1941]|uniref:Protein SQS1 n=1 Tax=Metarhizium album (strain ARSEF 1941) TaxID=1081103 RepID=A0A0B2X438_METAS|nr:Single-stranded nucleic acid binding R3H [Metarhizium album ARSEF 1941]KHO01119.1 Single-stranded nucleic acid binding R3H [Metarhizium album ARSEF 1941]